MIIEVPIVKYQIKIENKTEEKMGKTMIIDYFDTENEEEVYTVMDRLLGKIYGSENDLRLNYFPKELKLELGVKINQEWKEWIIHIVPVLELRGKYFELKQLHIREGHE